MGYDNIQLPTRFSKGSLFGPSFDTRIIALLDSKQEERLAHSPPGGQRKYNLAQGVADLSDLYELYEFFLAREGALNSFRLKDWLDYASTSTGSVHRDGDPAVAFDDQDLVLLNAPLNQYQIVKKYTSGPTVVTRTLRKMVSGTVLVGDDGGQMGSGFSVNLETGVVTFNSTPVGTAVCGYEFDVSARFTEETQKNFEVAIEGLEVGNLEFLCLEDVDPTPVSQDRPLGGAINHGAMNGANITWSPVNGLLQRFEPAVSGLKIVLIDPINLELGGPYAVFDNNGTETLTLVDHIDTTIVTIPNGTSVTLFLGVQTNDQKVWITQ